MDAASQVDQGSLKAIFEDVQGRIEQPIVQCVQIKPIAAQPGAPERYRIVVSDMTNYVQTMLATTANFHITQGQLQRGCFIRLKQYQANSVKGKKILIIMDLDVLEELGTAEKLGDPVGLEAKGEEAQPGRPTTVATNGFYGDNTAQQQEQQPQKSMPSHTKAPASSASHGNIYPIEALSPYSHKWTIKARCTSKSDIKTWHNRNGEGKLFSVNLLDESGEIRATGFQDQCEMLYDLFQEGSVYYISSPCRVQIAKKQFSNVNNDYELTFESGTVVEKAEEQDGVPQIKFNFTQIGDLQSVEKDTTIDVIGILKETAEISQITSKTTSKPYDKREITLVDKSNYSVRLTLWGKTATAFEVPPDSVVAFKGVKVSDFGGRSLSLLSSGSMTVDPDIDESYSLRGWYDASGKEDNYKTHAGVTSTVSAATGGGGDPFKTAAQVREEQLGMNEEKTDYFSIKGTIMHVRQANVSYPACLSEGCNKKVIEMEGEGWRCEKCDKNHPRPEWRYIMSMNIFDYTGQLWLNAFDEVGRMIMGMSADDLKVIEESDQKKFNDVFAEANCKTWNFKCRAKMDNFQDQQRVRYQVSSGSPLNFPTECEKLANIIRSYSIN